MTTYVLDASAGIELFLRSSAGQDIEKLITPGTVLWVPDGLFDVEVNGALRRLERQGILPTSTTTAARLRLGGLRLRRRRVIALTDRAWQLRNNISFPDACYVALAEVLDASLLTTDQRLIDSPQLPIRTIHP